MFKIKRQKSKASKLEWEEANDIRKQALEIVKTLDFSHINAERIFFFRTSGSKSRAYARTWPFPKIFQRALGIEPAYVIEVLSEYFDKLDEDNQKKVIIHELLHIPKNFSGSLIPHIGRNRNLHRQANFFFEQYKKSKA